MSTFASNSPRPRTVPSLYFVLAALFLAVASCSTSGGPGRGSGSGDITRAELDGQSFLSAYNAIEQLRPTWVRARGAPSLSRSSTYPVLYMDGIRHGDIDDLHTIAIGDVDTISYMSPSDATTRFGTGHTSGVILLTTR